MKLFFYAYKSWGHDSIWYFSCICRKFSELRALLFLSSTQTRQNLKFIHKCPCLSSLKNKFQWTQKKSKKSTPIQPQSVIGAPLLYIFKRCNSWECSVHFFRGPWLTRLRIRSRQRWWASHKLCWRTWHCLDVNKARLTYLVTYLDLSIKWLS